MPRDAAATTPPAIAAVRPSPRVRARPARPAGRARVRRPLGRSRPGAGSAADRPCSRRRSRAARRGPVRRRGRSRRRRRAGRRSPPRRRPPAAPERFADVVGIGPTAAARARGAVVVRDAQPDRPGAGGQDRRQGHVVALRHDDRQPARPERPGERGRGRRPLPDRRRLGRVGEEQHDRPVRRPVLGREQRLDPARRVERDRDPVDRVGRQGDDRRRPGGPRSPRPGRRRRPATIRAVMPPIRRPARAHGRGPGPRPPGPRRRARPARAARSGPRRPPRRRVGATYRAAARTGSGAVGIAAPWPTAASISRSLNWSPIASTFASGTPAATREVADAERLRHARGEELEEPRMARSSPLPGRRTGAGRRPSPPPGSCPRRPR